MTIAVLRYSVLRVLLFVAVTLLLALAGARGLLLVVLAVVISLALSYTLLRKQRDEVAKALVERQERRLGAPPRSADEDAEDAEIEASRRDDRL